MKWMVLFLCVIVQVKVDGSCSCVLLCPSLLAYTIVAMLFVFNSDLELHQATLAFFLQKLIQFDMILA